MRAKLRRKMWCGLASAALTLGVFQGVQSANAAGFLWIAAPAWSYSAAAAASPAGSVYFWARSVGAGTWTWAAAFSNSPFGQANAFAMAAAGRGGVGAWRAVGLADPYGGDAVDTSIIDPSNPSGYPSSDPATNPIANSYTVSDTGITFTADDDDMNSSDEIEAFLYTGSTTDSGLESEFGVDSDSGTTSTGDVTDIGTLESDLSLVPLDAPIMDPDDLSSLSFTENDSDVNTADVLLVGESEEVPEPVSASLLAVGAMGLLARRRRVMA